MGERGGEPWQGEEEEEEEREDRGRGGRGRGYIGLDSDGSSQKWPAIAAKGLRRAKRGNGWGI